MHIITSVGWLGAVATFLVLSIAGLTSHDGEVIRGAYLSMNLMGLYVIVPLSVAALLTGLVQSLGTSWGLFRYYWVLTKFVLTIGATVLLMMHQFSAVATVARRVAGTAAGMFAEVAQLGAQLLSEASFGLLALIAITTLSVYKPWGRTPYGERKQHKVRQLLKEVPNASAPHTLPDRDRTVGKSLPLGLKIFIAVTSLIVLMFGVMHRRGHSFHPLH